MGSARRRPTVPRKSILETVRTGPYHGGPRPVNANASLPVPLRAELLRHGFIETTPDGFLATEPSVGFVHRVRTLRRYALLNPREASQFERYVGQVFATFDLATVISDIVEKQTGVGRYRLAGDMYETFVRRNFWPEWIANSLADPLAGPMIAAIEGAGGPVPIEWLTESLKGHPPDEVRDTYDRLVNHLVLFEDLDGATWEILTGLLPQVRTERRKGRLKKPAKLEPIAAVDEGPEGGTEIPDLRAVLLEASTSPPRVKQDGAVRQGARSVRGGAGRAAGVDDGFGAGRAVGVGAVDGAAAGVRADEEGRGRRGRAGTDATGAEVAGARPRGAVRGDLPRPAQGRPAETAPRLLRGPGLPGCVGAGVVGRRVVAPVAPEHCRPLRDSLHALLMQLPLGSYFSMDQFVTWAGESAHNPLLLGRPKRDVTVYLDGRAVPPLDDHLAEGCRTLLRGLLNSRLVGMGCVRLGRRAGSNCSPGCRGWMRTSGWRWNSRLPAETRVIVQPDFSVVVIGLDPGPLAELTPFCERMHGSSEGRALTFRISRESVFRGIGGGLAPEAIVERFTRLSSHALPQNVLSEVKGWCAGAEGERRAGDAAPLPRRGDGQRAGRRAGQAGGDGGRDRRRR